MRPEDLEKQRRQKGPNRLAIYFFLFLVLMALCSASAVRWWPLILGR